MGSEFDHSQDIPNSGCTSEASLLITWNPASGQLTKTIAFQGERGAFSEEAVIKEFGAEANPLPLPTLPKVFESVEKGGSDFAVVPIENSLEGSVNETYDLLLDTRLKVTGEVKLRIHHCLIARPQSSLAGIRTVYSHPQALAQCRRTLSKLGAEVRPFYDTAGSVKFVAESSDLSIAAVASLRAAQIYGMKVLASGIEDLKRNYTRFLVLRRSPVGPVMGEGKTSLIFSTRHRPGTLYKALGAFAEQRVNLTKIESRPTKHTPWEYYFYIDLEGTTTSTRLKRALAEL